MSKPSANRGWFRRGEDPRRHKLTTEERQRGGYTRAAQTFEDWGPLSYWAHERRAEELGDQVDQVEGKEDMP